MPENNLSLVLHGINDMRFEERSVPKPGHDQVLIRVSSVGICGTDVHYLKHMACGKIVIKEPFVLGHETAGVIAELGEGVIDFKVTESPSHRVSPVVDAPSAKLAERKGKNGFQDGRCNLCRQGAVEKFFYATPPYDGSLRRYVIHDADLCVKLPDHVTMDEGALLEPLACAAHACYRAGITVSQNVLVLGAGPIGSLVMLTSRAYGVSKVVITDIDQARLDEAKKLGADAAINVRGKAVADVRQEIIAAFGGVEPDVSLDCTGVASSVETGILTTKTGGVVALVGLGQARSEVPLLDAACREIEIRGVLRYKDLKTALELVSTKKVDLTKLCAAHYKLEEGLDAFARFDKADVVKIFIHCD